MNIADLSYYVTLSEVADLVISSCRVNKATRVRILCGDIVLLDNDYYGDSKQEVHLDVRELVRNHTWLPVPGLFYDETTGKPKMVLAPSPAMDYGSDQEMVDGAIHGTRRDPGLRLEEEGRIDLTFEVTRYNNNVTEYSTMVFLCEKFVATDWRNTEEFHPDIDILQVPEDYLLPMSIFNLWKGDNGVDRYNRVELISARGKETYDSLMYYGASEYEACMATQLVKVSDVPHEVGVPFYMVITSYTSENGDPGGGTPHVINTPRFKVVKKKMEQYAFLSPEGIYYNIPMAGTLRHIPEYDISVLKKANSFEKTGGFISDLHEQNSGSLSRKTALALSRYLCSEMVYRYDPDKDLWRRIIIENPSVAIANSGGVYSLTFQWRYEDNDQYFNY